ncbi:MAG: PhzF family phenazine biosynthesis protein [archaeon]
MGFKIFCVDAFTDKAFAGNPAAVCILNESRDEAWMQNLAREMNLSETAFLYAQKDDYSLRWFTPAVEVDLCGHATLASAHVLWESRSLSIQDQARFHTRSGLLIARRKRDWIELDFPATPDQPVSPPAQLEAALGMSPKYVGKSRFDLLVEADSEETVRSLEPDFGLLREMQVRGVMVTSRATSSGYDFVSRFFAPGAGVDEDPVTGSAHCCLGPFWSRKLGKNELVAYQASSRGGTVRVRVSGEHVYLSGQAVTILHGELDDRL